MKLIVEYTYQKESTTEVDISRSDYIQWCIEEGLATSTIIKECAEKKKLSVVAYLLQNTNLLTSYFSSFSEEKRQKLVGTDQDSIDITYAEPA